MLRTRVIPILLLMDNGLVKTIKFKKPKYVGDPINAVKIFNEKEVDELIFLDINASKYGTGPDYEMVKDIASEAFMPLGYGGGIKSLNQIEKLLRIGVEKTIVNTAACHDTNLIRNASENFGSQSMVVSVDVKKNLFGKYEIFSHSGVNRSKENFISFIKRIEDAGAGEIMINSVDKDGTMNGYDLDLLQRVTKEVTVPVVACGGAGTLDHMKEAVLKTEVSAVAAGSMFVFYGKHRAVLITYPDYELLKSTFKS